MQLWPGRADLHRWSLVGQELQLLDDSWTKVFYQTNKKLQTLSILDLTFREASEMSRFFPPSGSAAALQQQSCFCVDVLRHEHHLTNDGATYVTYNQFTAWCEDEAWLFDFITRMGESSHLQPPPPPGPVRRTCRTFSHLNTCRSETVHTYKENTASPFEPVHSSSLTVLWLLAFNRLDIKKQPVGKAGVGCRFFHRSPFYFLSSSVWIHFYVFLGTFKGKENWIQLQVRSVRSELPSWNDAWKWQGKQKCFKLF